MAVQPLATVDVEQVVNLVARAGDPGLEMSLPERKRMLLEEVAEMVDADTWMWSNVTLSETAHGDAMTTSLIDGGYRNEKERANFYEFLSDPGASEAVHSKIIGAALRGRFMTMVRKEMISDREWLRVKKRRPTHLEHFIVASYPLGERVVSGIGYHRRAGRPDFTGRDRTIVHVVFQQVDWLHRHGSNAPAGDTALRLSPRERQVLVYLLGGDSLKEVARKLTISENTVANYVRGIYKSFSVNSRPQLLAHFLSGGQDPQ
jgi:DNA-binding CsgD family transcriptional regulator